MNALDKAMIGFGLSGAFVALRWACALDPKIALLSQIVFSFLPAAVQPAALGVWYSWQWISMAATQVVNVSLALTGALLNLASGSFSQVQFSEAIGGGLLIVAAISALILLPAMIVVPFAPAVGTGPIVIAGMNIAVSIAYFGRKQMTYRRPPAVGLPLYQQQVVAAAAA